MDTTKTITHLSLCTGYEGIGLGLRRVLPNLREIAYVEREGFACSNLVAKIESGQLDEAPIFTDVKTFPYGKFLGKVSVLSGGFPCQPFSAAGKRQATEDPRHLFPYIRDGIRDCQPRIVFLENVEGIISAKTGDGESVLQYVLRELEGLGYRATAGVFSASEVGAPHQRKRVFILGVHQEMANPNNDRHRENPRRNEKAEGLSREHRSEVCRGLPNRTGKELGNASGKRCEQNTALRSEQQASWTNEVSRESRGKLGISNANSTRLERLRKRNASQRREEQDGYPRSRCEVFPVRPNEPQHKWEEPRVKSRLGRATNGTASRVDRLRLLGNGVVPATAAKAFLTLINRFL